MTLSVLSSLFRFSPLVQNMGRFFRALHHRSLVGANFLSCTRWAVCTPKDFSCLYQNSFVLGCTVLTCVWAYVFVWYLHNTSEVRMFTCTSQRKKLQQYYDLLVKCVNVVGFFFMFAYDGSKFVYMCLAWRSFYLFSVSLQMFSLLTCLYMHIKIPETKWAKINVVLMRPPRTRLNVRQSDVVGATYRNWQDLWNCAVRLRHMRSITSPQIFLHYRECNMRWGPSATTIIK